MRKDITTLRFSIGLCILLLMAVFTTPGFAQDEEASQQLLSFTYFQVKPGMGLEFEELIKNKTPLFQEMGMTEMDIFKTSNFGMWEKYLVISPLEDPAELDAELSKQRSNMVPAPIVSLISAMSRMVVSVQSFVLITMPEFNIPAADDYEGKLIGSVTIGTATGSDKEFEKGIKKVIKAIGKTDVKGVLLGRVGLGGNINEYILYTLYDSFKEMLNNETAIQKELAAIDLASLDKVTKYRESEVFVRIPELCIKAATD